MEKVIIKKGVLEMLKTRAESITIPKNVKSIKGGALYSTHNVKEFLVDEENKYFTSCDGVIFTKDMKKLVAYPKNKAGKEYIIPDGVETICECALSDSKNLVSLIMPDSVKVVKEDALVGMEKLKKIRFSESLKTLPSISCSNVKDVTIPQSVKKIERMAFSCCDKIKKITIPQGVKVIEEEAFAGTSIQEVTLPKYLVNIHPNAFCDDGFWGSDLKEIKVEKGNRNFEFIDGALFHKRDKALVVYPYCKEGEEYSIIEGTKILCNLNNKYLKKVSIPESMNLIYIDAMADCPDLEEIVVDKNNEHYVSVDGVLFTKDMKILMAYPKNKKDKEYVIPDGVEVIQQEAFSNCKNLLKVTMPDSINTVEQFSFYLTSIIEMNLRGDVDANAIWSAPIEKLTIENSVKEIKSSVFHMCYNLESVRIPETVEKIYDLAFAGCEKLTEVIIESKDTTIEKYAFLHSDKVTIFAPKGSKAEAFAKEEGFEFKPLGEELV